MESFPAPITNKEVEDFHRANPPDWYVPGEIPPPSPDDEFDSLVSGSMKVNETSPQKSFLDATNPWLLRPDGEPEEKMSMLGKAYLGCIKWVFRNAIKELTESKGQTLTDPIIVAGMPVNEYLKMIKLNIETEEEFNHIHDVTIRLQDLLNTVHLGLIAKKDNPEPRPSLLERLEGRQRHGAFGPTKKEN